MATYQPGDDEVRQFAKQPAVKRMEALFDVEARYEARLEWMYLLEALDDPTRIVAAQYALLKGWYDLAVLAADKTSRTHNFELRYPPPATWASGRSTPTHRPGARLVARSRTTPAWGARRLRRSR